MNTGDEVYIFSEGYLQEGIVRSTKEPIKVEINEEIKYFYLRSVYLKNKDEGRLEYEIDSQIEYLNSLKKELEKGAING